MPAKKKSRISKSKPSGNPSIPRWVIILLVIVTAGLGIFLIYRSFAAAKPNLRFQIQKNGVCVNSVNNNDTSVNIKISRDTGTAQINNIRVYVDGSPVATSPSSINGPVSNLAIASPSLAQSPTTHSISVTGNNVSQGAVTFSPYCEATGSTSNTVSISAPLPATPTPVRPTTTPAPTTQSQTGTNSTTRTGADLSFLEPRQGYLWCLQGRCSIHNNGGIRTRATLQFDANCQSLTKYRIEGGGKETPRWQCAGIDDTANGIVQIPGIAGGVNASISGQVSRMINDARSRGIILTGTGYRSPERQLALRFQNCPDPYSSPASACSPPTALPGTSMHERGLAIDFDNCSYGSAVYNWLRANASRYGLRNLPSESWHWSTTGS